MERKLWIRITNFENPDFPVMFVAERHQLTKDIHILASETRRQFGRKVDVEIFPFEGSMPEATLEASRRSASRIPEEKHLRDTLYDFLIMSFILSHEKTVISPASPTPLPAEEIRSILLEVMEHPAYKGQVVLLSSMEGKRLYLENKTVMVREEK